MTVHLCEVVSPREQSADCIPACSFTPCVRQIPEVHSSMPPSIVNVLNLIIVM
jgi:hypothetical protein